MTEHTHLLVFSIGPVQSFIAEARRTADLFAGSQILAQVACAAAQAMSRHGELIYPVIESLHCDDNQKADTPNVIVALVNDPKTAAEQAKTQALEKWRSFADDAWEKLADNHDPDLQKIWQRQRDNHLEFYWIAVPHEALKYKDCYELARKALTARKRTRNFTQPPNEDGPKDSLSGSRSALRTGKQQAQAYWQHLHRQKTSAELQAGELLDTIGAMKRFALDSQRFPSTSTVAATTFIKQAKERHQPLLAELVEKISTINEMLKNLPPDIDCADEDELQTIRRVFDQKKDYLRHIKNTADPAFPYGGDLLYQEGWTRSRLEENYDKLPDSWYQHEAIKSALECLKKLHRESNVKLTPYYAILQMDGDNMGMHVSKCKTREQHQKLSRALSEFTEKAKEIVETNNGYLIYAGGDDVLAFFPADYALSAANALAQTYQEKFQDWQQSDNQGKPFPFTASTGVAFAHYLQPLDLVLETTHRAEKRAKNSYGRNALCVTVLRRSGERLDVGGKWAGEPKRENSPAPDTVNVMTELVKYLAGEQLSSRFPYNALRDAPIVTAIDKQARKSILQQLVKQHKSKTLNDETANKLVEKWLKWANSHDAWVPTLPEAPKMKDQGFQELARWFVLARWLAGGGRE